MIGTLIALALASSEAPPAPFTVPFTVPRQDLAVRAEVGGEPRTLLLGTFTPGSYVRDAPPPPTDLSLGGHPLARLGFTNRSDPETDGDGALGTDLLGKVAVGVDLLAGTATFWPGGSLPSKEAEAWVKALPAGSVPVAVRRLDARRLPYGGLTLDCAIGGKTIPLGLRLAFYGSTLEPSVPRPALPLAPWEVSLLPSFSVGGLPPVPEVYLPGPEGSVSPIAYGAAGTVSLDQLGSRRVLVDFPAGRVYVEVLSMDERLTWFLRRLSRAPVNVEGDRIVLKEVLADRAQYPALAPYMGAEVVRLGDGTAAEWLTDLRGSGKDRAASLADRIKRLHGTYDIEIRKADGSRAILHAPSASDAAKAGARPSSGGR